MLAIELALLSFTLIDWYISSSDEYLGSLSN